MFQRDFILRQIQELIQVIARIMGLRMEGNYEEARSHIEHTLQTIWNVHREELLLLSEDKLLELCHVNGVFHTEFSIALADLLAEDGHIYMEQGSKNKALACYKQSHILHDIVLAQSEAAPYDIYDRISKLEAQIESLESQSHPEVK